MSNNFKDMTILSIPEALLVYLNCKDSNGFQCGIIHCSTTFDYVEILLEKRYCSVSMQMIFRNRTLRTAIIPFISEKILLKNNEMICVNKISNIIWQNDSDLACDFLSILEGKVRLKCIRSKVVERDDCTYVAVAIKELMSVQNIKTELKFLHVLFNVAVSFEDIENSRTYKITKCHLFPIALINTCIIEHTGLYSIITMKPHPLHVYASEMQKDVFGLTNSEINSRMDFMEVIQKMHTTLEYINETLKEVVEFITRSGKKMFEVHLTKVKNNCIIAVFKRV